MSAITTAIPQPPPCVSAAPAPIPPPDARPASTPTATRVFELNHQLDHPNAELLRHRFLSRTGSLLMVGNTGIGKSSLTMQMMIHWALGRGCFDILPAFPLKSLLIQGENDLEDLVEMRDGVVGAMELTEAERAIVNDHILIRHEYERYGQDFADEVLEPLLAEHQPHLVWLDPVLQYLGGDSNQQEVVGEFLRQSLGVLVKRHQCAVVLVHHTNKPSRNAQQNQQRQSAQLHAYDGAGSAEFSNWPRAVLSLLPTKQAGEYRLVAGKRGQRLQWRMPDQTTPCYEKLLRHSRQPGVICWEEAVQQQPAQPVNGQPPVGNAAAPVNIVDPITQAIYAQLPPGLEVEKQLLMQQVNRHSRIGINKIRPHLNRLVTTGLLVETPRPLPGRKDAIDVQRAAQPPPPAAADPQRQPPPQAER
jgi:hypothetical protein